MLPLVILSSFFGTVALFVDKHLVNKGISRKDYFYYMCLSMIPFAMSMVIIESFSGGGLRFELNIFTIILLLIAAFLRYKKQHTIVGCLTYLSPYESIAYTSLGLILAFIIDGFLGLKSINIMSLLAIFMTITGVFLIADVKLKIKSLKKDLILRIICDVSLGYVAHYILKYWDGAIYILVLNLLLTLIFSKRYTIKYHLKNKNIIKWIFIQQTFGFASVYLGNYLVVDSVTLYQLQVPITIIMTIVFSFVIKSTSKKPKLKDFVAILMVSLGIYLLNL